MIQLEVEGKLRKALFTIDDQERTLSRTTLVVPESQTLKNVKSEVIEIRVYDEEKKTRIVEPIIMLTGTPREIMNQISGDSELNLAWVLGEKLIKYLDDYVGAEETVTIYMTIREAPEIIKKTKAYRLLNAALPSVLSSMYDLEIETIVEL